MIALFLSQTVVAVSKSVNAAEVMELSALRNLASAFSSSSSVSSTSSHESRAGRHRGEHRHRAPHTADDNEDERDDVYHRHRKNRRRSFDHRHRQRHHTGSSLTDKSMSSSHHSRKESDEVSLASTCDDRPRLNLPLDKEFLPLESPTPQEKEQEQVRDQVICMIFDLPESTQFYQDFSCAIASTLAMHGRMYPTSSHVCFYSNVFGRERKILIPYESIREIEKTTTMMFQHAIRLATLDKDEYTFTSFWSNNRDTCYDLIVKTRDRVLRELRPPAENSSESTYPALPTSPVSRPSQSPAASPPPSPPSSTVEEEEEEAATSDHAAAGNDDANVDDDETDADDQTAPVTPRRRSVVSDVDTIAPKDISMTQILEEVFPVSVDTFMKLFYLDKAPFGLDKFNEQTGSTEMTINPWTTPLEDEESFGMTRSLQFRVPVDAPIGPKSSQVDVLQCLKENEHGVRVVESSTRLVDIPYGDYFSVEDRWTIVPRSSDPNACKVFIELKVVFGKSTFWKKTIETRAISDNRAKWEKWVSMAKEFLDTRDLHEAANCASESAPTSSSSSEKATVHGVMRKDRGPTTRHRSRSRSRSKPSHRYRSSTAVVMPTGARTAPVKVFPWVLVLLLLFVILRLQMSLSRIEHSLLVNTELMSDLQRQIVGLQTGACSVTS
ncbi:VAD1-like StAR-related lipid transfer domain [Phytophthora infestans]|uniref:VAD1-like StAR-related lipid transfer domain n=1 Tax=Phytophthora infestans TaxID=4787 RepID=A0A8S9VGH1_PHYIN|nr:VAD1-like StAR-related lipid transfer domain [Phytophthora infestans]